MTQPSRPFGASLIEVMVVMLVTGAGLLGLIRLQMELSTSSSLARQRTEALALAQSRIEEFRRFPAPAVYDEYFKSGALVSGTATLTGQNAVYAMSWTAIDQSSQTLGRYANLAVTVAWQDTKAGSHTARLESSVARYDRTGLREIGSPGPASCAADVVQRWNVGSSQCIGRIPSGGQLGDVRIVSATSGSGTSQYVCATSPSGQSDWQQVGAYPSTCVDECPAGIVSWSGSNQEACSAKLGVAALGSVVRARDDEGAVTGESSFQCSNGIWQPVTTGGAATCTATCPAADVTWGPVAECNDQRLELATAPAIRSLNFSSGKITATASYSCDANGVWRMLSSACRDQDNRTLCPSALLNWKVADFFCEGSVADTPSGQSLRVKTETGALMSGEATFSCVDGRWSLPAASPAATCASGCTLTFSGALDVSAKGFGLRRAGAAEIRVISTCSIGSKNYTCSTVPFTKDVAYDVVALKDPAKVPLEVLATASLPTLACGGSLGGVNFVK